jgi:arylsulfatase A-like enzyme
MPIRLLLALCALAALAACSRGEGEPEREKPAPGAPNIVVVMTDDQALDTMRAMPRTRRLLGGSGVTFEAAVASFPLCCPSRATFLTGRYAHNHGVLDNSAPKGGIGRLDQEETLPVWLRRAGYRTAFVGKYLNGYGKDEHGGPKYVPPGWDEWYGMTSKTKTAPFDYELNVNGELQRFGDAEDDYKTDVLARLSRDFVRRAAQRKEPFFLWVATSAPHVGDALPGSDRNPLPAPRHHGAFEGARAPRGPAFNEADVRDKPANVRSERRLRGKRLRRIDDTYVSQLEALLAVDDLVAELVRELRRAGALRNTIVVFTSDNGYLRGQHRIDSGKSRPYEEAILVPLLVRGPGFPKGVTTKNPVVNADLAATFLAAARARPDEPVDGVPLTRALRPAGAKRAVLIEVFERKADQFQGLRTARYTYVERDGDRDELYDLREDPAQLRNVIDDPRYARVREELARRLAQLRDCRGKDCR